MVKFTMKSSKSEKQSVCPDIFKIIAQMTQCCTAFMFCSVQSRAGLVGWLVVFSGAPTLVMGTTHYITQEAKY